MGARIESSSGDDVRARDGVGGGTGAVKNETGMGWGPLAGGKRRPGGTGRAKAKRWGHPFMLYFWLLRVQSSGRHTFA